jgi:formylglycine-generating enzyme required for sulfatase activity
MRARLSLVVLLLTLTRAAGAQLAPVRDSIPGTLVRFELVPVSGGRVTVGGKAVEVKPFLIGRTELSWEAYDPFAFGPGSGGARGSADAVSRPSRPYGAPDYGWGHAGFPAISVTRNAAEAYCRWLSERTGRTYRLPTEAEWVRAAQLAAGSAPFTAARRELLAWHRGNAGDKSHRIASKRADALGLHDLFGNAAEWVTTDDGKLVTRGGSWRDRADSVGPNARAVQDDSWNERDPQIPKSPWWLSDGPFVGFRVVREP